MANSLRPLEIFPITTRYLQVIRTQDVTPGMRRVTIGGDGLHAHIADNGYPVAEFKSFGFDDEFKILIEHPDADMTIGPTQLDGVLNWHRGEGAKLMRTYTVRRWDPVAGEIDVDFVNHGVGPATSWARNVQPGETIQIAGPKSSSTHPEGADWVLVGADETALPAVARWLEEWPKGARGQFFIEVEDNSHRQDLVIPDGVELTWLLRHGAEAGTTTLLFEALKQATWWEGTVFAWVAGEAGTLAPIRRWLRKEKCLDKEQIEVTGYWKRHNVIASAENPELPDFAATENSREKFHELTEIMPGFALRVAATLNLGSIMGAKSHPIETLAQQTGASEQGLYKLLRYLEELGLTTCADGAWQLTDIGRELDNDDVAEELDLNGHFARREMAVMNALLGAIGDGEHPGYDEPEGLTPSRVADDTEFAGWISGALIADPAFANVSSIAIMGVGAMAFAHAVADKYAETAITVIGSKTELSAMKAQSKMKDRIKFQRVLEDVEVVLLVEAVNERSDFEAIALLKEAATHGRLLYFGRALDPMRAHDHDYEEDLGHFALHGGGSRTAEELDALFTEAGLGPITRKTIGWGITLCEFGA